MPNSKVWTMPEIAALVDAAKDAGFSPRKAIRIIRTAKETREDLATHLKYMLYRLREGRKKQ